MIFNNKILGEEKKRGNCFKRSAIYSNQCQLCKSKGVVTQYIGDPGKAHLRDQRSIWQIAGTGEVRHIRDHLMLAHQDLNIRDRQALCNSFQMVI